MNFTEEQRQTLNETEMLRYLEQNPDFFMRHARWVEQMRLPHVVRGSVSLVEWQLSRQRQQITLLEEEITLLMERSQDNERLFVQLLQLQQQLLTAESLQQLLDRLQTWAQQLGLSAYLRLFNEQWQLSAPSEFISLGLSRQTFEPLRIQRIGQKMHYLGNLNSSELLLLLPAAKQVGSVALSLLGEQGELGVLIFTSRHPHHYHMGMDTLLLDQLAALLPALLSRWITRR